MLDMSIKKLKESIHPTSKKVLKKRKCHLSLKKRIAISGFVGGVIDTTIGFTIIFMDEYMDQKLDKALLRAVASRVLSKMPDNKAAETQAGHIGALIARIMADRMDGR